MQASAGVAAQGGVGEIKVDIALLAGAHSGGKSKIDGVSLSNAGKRVLQRVRIAERHTIAARGAGDFLGAGGQCRGSADGIAAPARGTEDDAAGQTSGVPRIAALRMHGIRSDQRHEHGVRASERAFDGFFVSLALGLIVGDDHDGATGIAPSLAADVVSRVEQTTGDIGAATEIFVIEHALKLAIDAGLAAAEVHTDTRSAVENHDGDAVFVTELMHRVMRSGGDALDVRAHAGAHIEQQQQIDRKILGVNALNRHGPALLAEEKIAGG